MFASEIHFLELLIKPFLIGAFAGWIFAFLSSRLNKGENARFTDILVVIPVVLIAYIAGYLTGISGSSAIGNLVPAALAFIGGVNAYILSTKSAFKSLTIFSIFLFAIILFYGALDGGYDRIAGLDAQLQAQTVRELHIRNLRQNLGLPADPPSWAAAGE
jgi:hypothetical protein